MDSHIVLKPIKTMNPIPAAADQTNPTIMARTAGVKQIQAEIFVVIQKFKFLFGLRLPRVNKNIIKPMKMPKAR